MSKIQNIVVIGGTGHFGARICRRLAGEANTKLYVTSRNRNGATLFVSELTASNPESRIEATVLDQFDPLFEKGLRALEPDIVLHTAGPYQGMDYRVAEACIAAGSHYIDLADGRDFVERFSRLHNDAIQAGVLLVSGASTLPGLSSAVIDYLKKPFLQIDEIEISIAPAHQTPRGIGTISAVLSYCGRPFQVLSGGRWTEKYGWQDFRIQHYPSIGKRLSAACDVPDLTLMPTYVTGVRTVTFHAALEAWWEQIALWMMAALVRVGVTKNWSRFARSFRWMSDRMIRIGSDTGAMRIRVTGKDSRNKRKVSTWFLIARNNHGPEIPCTPALILARKLARGEIVKRGAFPCLGLFTLEDFDAEIAPFDVLWTAD